MAVDLDDRVVDVEQRIPLAADGVSMNPQQAGESGQREQEPRGDRVELTDVTEGERAQERTQRRGGVGPGEDPTHPAVTQQRHVIDRVRTGDHPAHE